MKRYLDPQMWYWVAMGLLLAGALAGCPLGMAPVIGVGLVLTLHALGRHGRLGAFPVQVRLGFLMLLVAGLWSPLAFIHVTQMAGLTALLVFDYCPLARFLSLMPWNRPRASGLREMLDALLTPPSAFRPLVA
jgi:hypothetical protein